MIQCACYPKIGMCCILDWPCEYHRNVCKQTAFIALSGTHLVSLRCCIAFCVRYTQKNKQTHKISVLIQPNMLVVEDFPSERPLMRNSDKIVNR